MKDAVLAHRRARRLVRALRRRPPRQPDAERAQPTPDLPVDLPLRLHQRVARQRQSLGRWLSPDLTKTSVQQPVRSISARARASARSVFTGRASSAFEARRRAPRCR